MNAPGRVKARTAGTIRFSDREVARAIDLIDASGVAPLLEDLLPAGGRPRSLTVRPLLVALLLLAQSGEPTYLNRIPRLLNNLPRHAKLELGIPDTGVTRRVTDRMFGHLGAELDGSIHSSNPQTDEDRQLRDQALQLIVDRIIAASLPDDDVYTSTGDLAFDATFIDANSRPVATRKRSAIAAYIKAAAKNGEELTDLDVLSSDRHLARALGVGVFGEDPDDDGDLTDEDRAALGLARATARRAADPDAATIVHKGVLRHAYALHLAVEVPSRDQVAARLARQIDERRAAKHGTVPTAPVPDPTPLLVRRLVVTASTAAPGATGSALLVGLPGSAPGKRNGWKPADVVADRGYSGAAPTNWHDPLRTAGYTLIHDLHAQQRGHTRVHDGIVIIDGEAYSPGILNYPKLFDIAKPPIGAGWADLERYQQRIERRRPFLLPRHTTSKPGEPLRLACPAVRGKVACPLRGNLALTATGAPEVFVPPAAPLPLICTAKTVRVPDDVLVHRQDAGLLYGSREWYDAYTRRRARVEGMNGIVKNPAGGHFDDMRIRVRGRSRVSLLVAFIVASANLAQTESWLADRDRARELDQLARAARRSRKPAAKSRHARTPGDATRQARAPGAA